LIQNFLTDLQSISSNQNLLAIEIQVLKEALASTQKALTESQRENLALRMTMAEKLSATERLTETWIKKFDVMESSFNYKLNLLFRDTKNKWFPGLSIPTIEESIQEYERKSNLLSNGNGVMESPGTSD
jgi:hypothetical protein